MIFSKGCLLEAGAPYIGHEIALPRIFIWFEFACWKQAIHALTSEMLAAVDAIADRVTF